MMHTKPTTPLRSARVLSALSLFAIAIALSLTGCKKSEQSSLPPASGEGSPEATKIPTLSELQKEAPVAVKEEGTRAGTGSLQALNYAALGPKETGVITAIGVKEGERVKKGQMVFKLDAVQAELMIDQAKAAVATAKVQQLQAQLDFDRTKALRERGSATEDMFDQAKTRLDAINATITQAQTAVNLAQRRLSNLTVTSPIDGIVTEKKMNIGETATQVPVTIIAVIQDIDTLELRARLPETALKVVREGAQITVRFPATDEKRQVTIKRISPNVDARTRTIEIVSEITNTDHALKAGMLAEVEYGSERPATAQAEHPAPAAKIASAQEVAK